MDGAAAWNARVVPVLGKGLSAHHVTVEGGAAPTLLLEMLAACRLERAALVHRPAADDARWLELVEGMGTAAWLRHKNPWAPVHLEGGRTDVCVSVTTGETAAVMVHAAGRRVTLTLPHNRWDALDVLWWGARVVRDLCLGRLGWMDARWVLGDARWPFTPRASTTAVAQSGAEPAATGHILVVGCGSLGSEAARVLQGHASRWTLVDGGVVSVFNPVRQWFGGGDVGRPKVEVMASHLRAPVRAVRWNADATADRAAWERLLRQDRPDVVLLATGTHHHGALAQVCWELGIPHVAVCCYPRARFFETAVMVPSHGTPCLECYRGHLYRGAPAPLPVTTEEAQFLYSQPDQQRAETWKDLVAEPATRVETVRAAWVAARCVAGVLAREKPAWMARMLDEETTCLLGGHDVVTAEDGSAAYGLEVPGQVMRLGVPDLHRAQTDGPCPVCRAGAPAQHAPCVATPDEELALLG